MNLTTHQAIGDFYDINIDIFNTSSPTAPDSLLLSNEVALIFQITFLVILSALAGLFGIIANIINIIVFVKQGAYKECGSVNLLGLAVSDLCVATTMLYLSLGFGIVFMNLPNLSWEPFDVVYVTGGWPHLMSAQITRGITAFVAFERCMCVVFPFKVKSMLSPARSAAVIVALFISFIATYAPAFIMQRLEYVHNPVMNRSRLVIVSSPDWLRVVDIMWYINSLAFNVTSVGVVLICTLITASRLKLSKEWRESSGTGKNKSDYEGSTDDSSKNKISNLKTNQTQQGHSRVQQQKSKINSSKEKRLIVMIVTISIIFLICYIPDFMFMLMYSINSDIRMLGKYQNLALMMYALTFFMETFNSSINILVYYRMSTRYRQVFLDVICSREVKNE